MLAVVGRAGVVDEEGFVNGERVGVEGSLGNQAVGERNSQDAGNEDGDAEE